MKKTRMDQIRTAGLLIGAAAFNFLVYYGGRFLDQDRMHYNFTTSLDTMIPLVPWTVYIYWGAYLFWIANYTLSAIQSREDCDRFILSHMIGETVCFFVFVFLPTTMTRPEISGSSPAETLLRLTYRFDSADNLLPSIHCFASWLSWIGVRGKQRIPKWYQFLSLLIAIAICVSTLTVKQHVLVDAAAGILLAELGYYLAGAIQKKILCSRCQ